MFSLLDLLVPYFSRGPDGLYIDCEYFISEESCEGGSEHLSEQNVLSCLFANCFYGFETDVGGCWWEDLVHLLEEKLSTHCDLVRCDNFIDV